MTSTDPNHYLEIARKHLRKVQDAWEAPDWDDLTTYGLYCLEACIRAAVLKNGDIPVRTHYGKVDQSNELALNHGFPNIEDLLKELNDGRKANAYGDAVFDEDKHDAEDIAVRIEAYFAATENHV